MAFLKKITAGKRRPEPKKFVEIEVTDPARQIPDLIHWASKGEELRMVLPSSLLRTKGAFGFHGGWSPMMAPLEDDIATFKKFFELFQPKNLGEFYFLDAQLGPGSLDPAEMPWLFWSKPQPSPASGFQIVVQLQSLHGTLNRSKCAVAPAGRF